MTGDAEKIVTFLMGQDRSLIWDLSPHKDKRSLNQNSYYWSLAGKVARAMSISTARLHNMLLRDVGLLERMDDKLIPVYLPDTDEAEEKALEAETYHIKPTSQVKTDKEGKSWRCYVMLRGSHSFNTAEMSALVDLMVQEANGLGIETITPAELAHMREMEAQHERRS